MAIVGWFLTVLGCAGLAVSFIAGAREVLSNPPVRAESGGPLGWLEAIKEILSLGGWRALAGISFAALLLGLALLGVEVFVSGDGETAMGDPWRPHG